MIEKNRFFRALQWSNITALTVGGGSFLVLLILVRFLSTEDFALMALGQTLLGIGSQLLIVPLTNAIIQHQEINNSKLNTLFWLSLILALIFGGFILLFRNLFAHFFQAEELKSVLLWMVPGLIFQASSIVYIGILQKKLFFDKIGKVQLLGFISGSFAAILLAINGWGVWALIISYLIKTCVESILMFFSGYHLFFPRFSGLNFQNIRALLIFSSFQSAERLIDTFIYQLDTIIIGKWLGLEALGIYDVLKKIIVRPINLFSSAIEAVAFPLLAKKQTDIAFLSRSYLHLTQQLSAFLFPLMVILICWAESIIFLILGEEWASKKIYFQLICLLTIIRIPKLPLDTLLLALGKAQWWLWWKLFIFFLLPVFLVVGITYKLEGIIIAHIIFQTLLIPTAFHLLIKNLIAIKSYSFLNSFLKPFLLAITTIFPFYIFSQLFTTRNSWTFAIFIFLAILNYGIVSIYYQPEFIGNLRKLLKF